MEKNKILTLIMTFKTDEGKTTDISIRNADPTLESTQVKSVMQLIIDSNLFVSAAGSLIAIHSAQIVEKTNTGLAVI